MDWERILQGEHYKLKDILGTRPTELEHSMTLSSLLTLPNWTHIRCAHGRTHTLILLGLVRIFLCGQTYTQYYVILIGFTQHLTSNLPVFLSPVKKERERKKGTGSY